MRKVKIILTVSLSNSEILGVCKVYDFFHYIFFFILNNIKFWGIYFHKKKCTYNHKFMNAYESLHKIAKTVLDHI